MLQRSVSIRRDALLDAEAKNAMLEEQRKSLLLAAQSLRQPDIIWPEAPARLRRSSSSRFMLTSLEDMEEEGQPQSAASLLSGSQLAGPAAGQFLSPGPLLPRRSPSRRRTGSSILDLVGAGNNHPPHEHQHGTMLDAASTEDPGLTSMVSRGPHVDRRAGHRTISMSLDGGTSEVPPRHHGQNRQQQQAQNRPQNRPHDHQAGYTSRESQGLIKRSSSSIGFISRVTSIDDSEASRCGGQV